MFYYRTGIGSPKNHGFVTTMLNGRRVPVRVIQLTLAHELGHSFGSTHDPSEIGNVTVHPARQLFSHLFLFVFVAH